MTLGDADNIIDKVRRVSKQIAKLQAKNQQLYYANKTKSKRRLIPGESTELLYLNDGHLRLLENGDVPSKCTVEFTDGAESFANSEMSLKKPACPANSTQEAPRELIAVPAENNYSRNNLRPKQFLSTHAISELLKQQFLDLDPSTCSVRISESRESRRSIKRVRMKSIVQKTVEMRKRCEMFQQELDEEVERGLNKESPQVVALLRNYSKLEQQIKDLKKELGDIKK